ncbi:YceD family protein [Falsochrobactrum ovis]|uniref:Uncharacterized metal-binding protein YceD (DUF177 family) n=1 Tax=Falsochrobactrum ovis TaxID=1293442 RepID=A0A364JVG4_9HYPH|nr:DUF177 domain-containing protein [Falsochrobactrum ovis]RAK29081.1 uncharacterized metal-binding protein YceD (DUF177 family) [Falsochrobactrum ovis]
MTDKPALTYPVPVLNLPQKGLTIKIGTTESERGALAAQHGLEAVIAFDADMLLTRWKKNGVRVRGQIEAQIVQLCVVTLEPITNNIREEIDTTLVPENSRLARMQLDEMGELVLDAEGADIPETFSGDKIDLGALVTEFFELAIDPYPRKPGISTETPPMVYESGDQEIEPDSAFAKLAQLRNKP